MESAVKDRNKTMADEAMALFDGKLGANVPALTVIPNYSEDDVLELTRKIRIRQLALDLDANEGQLSADPEERKIQLAMLKDLDSQATKIKMIGAKEKASEADREASLAVQRMLQLVGERPYRRDPTAADGEPLRDRPSIADATHLPPLELKPDEAQVGLDTTTYEELMERTGNV
jgi:hypothetical protein